MTRIVFERTKEYDRTTGLPKEAGFLLLATLFLLTGFSRAESATQTDWSGGPGVSGPVEDWGNTFSQAWGIVWSDPGRLLLEQGSNLMVDDSLLFPRDIHFCDLSGNGHGDILLTTWSGGEILLWENSDTSPGIIWTKVPILENFQYCIHAITVGDLDTDGDLDVAAAIHTPGMCWFENQGSGNPWTLRSLDSTMTQNTNDLHAGDINGDGFIDVVVAAAYDDITWLRNEGGTGTEWSELLITSSFPNPHSVICADIDGDGFMDVVTGGSQGHVAWYRNIYGSGNAWQPNYVESGLSPVLSVQVGDIDGDGDLDITAALNYRSGARDSESGEALVWWENIDGTGTSWVKHVVAVDIPGLVIVEAADLDSDGDMDLLGGTSTGTDGHSWYENADGAGSTWIRHPLTGGYTGGGNLCAGDVNKDGALDLIGTVAGSTTAVKDLVWWNLQGGYTTDGCMESSVLYLNGDPSWGMLESVDVSPTGTATAFQVRASDNPEDLGAWSDTLTAPCSLEGILSPYDSYLQYRVILHTEYPLATPELMEITVHWYALAVDRSTETFLPPLLSISPNPSSDPVTVRFTTPYPMTVRLSLFDLTGRLITDTEILCQSSGTHSASLGELLPGLYFSRLQAGTFSASQRFIVVE